jgi:hypothetical protein
MRESGGDADKLLMLAQGLPPDAWQRAAAADAETQAEHDGFSEFNQAIFRSRNGYFLGPDERIYVIDEALGPVLDTAGTLQNLDGMLAAALTREAMKDGRIKELAELYPQDFADALIRTMGGGRGSGLWPLLGMAIGGAFRGKGGNGPKGQGKNAAGAAQSQASDAPKMPTEFKAPVGTQALKKLPGGDKGFDFSYKEWWNKEGRALHESLPDGGVGRRISPSQSFIWQSLDRVKGRDHRTNGLTGKDLRYFRWDWGGGGRHRSEIEVFDGTGKPLGTIDAITGSWLGDAPKRRLPIKVSELDPEPGESAGPTPAVG